MTDKRLWLWLSLAFKVASPISDKLLFDFENDPQKIYDASPEALEKALPGNSRLIEKLSDKSLQKAEQILDFCERENVGILTQNSQRYPASLLSIVGKPIVLYYKGRLPDFSEKLSIGVVGTRHISNYGSRSAYSISHDLAKSGVIVVSGMARGADVTAHRGALDALGTTVAILGSGIDVIYPKEHTEIYKELILNGMVMTEYPPGSPPDGWRFPQRNRIISGLSAGILVIEAPKSSGALITADYAKKQGKLLYAVPGKVGEKTSLGTNELIRNGAKMVTCADDIISDFKHLYGAALKALQPQQRNVQPQRKSISPWSALQKKFPRFGSGIRDIRPANLSVARPPFIPANIQEDEDGYSYLSIEVDPRMQTAMRQHHEQEERKKFSLIYPEGDVPMDGYETVPFWEMPPTPVKSKKPVQNATKKNTPPKKKDKKNDSTPRDFSTLSENERKVAEFLETHGKSLPDEVAACGLPIQNILSALVMLEIKGLTEKLDGGYYILKN